MTRRVPKVASHSARVLGLIQVGVLILPYGTETAIDYSAARSQPPEECHCIP